MIQIKKENMKNIAPLFNGWDETLIWSCLQGCMGMAWADNENNPKSAQIITGDFCCFAGLPNIELTKNIPEDHTSEFILMIPQNDKWSKMIENVYGEKCEKILRYAIKKEYDIFDKDLLSSFVNGLPKEYTIEMIDEDLFNKLKTEEWSYDLCSLFKSYDEYEKHGLGAVVINNGIPVSGASSYGYYDKGIEIEIDTKLEYRRKGLATACAAKLILDCLERNLYPSWDAHDLRSVALAEKLGYHLDKSYVTYVVTTSKH